MATKLIIHWDQVQLTPSDEWKLWHQLRGAYAITDIAFVPRVPDMLKLGYGHYDTMAEALAASIGALVFLEAGGSKDVSEIPKAGDITIIVGNTQEGNASLAEPDEMYSIQCPAPGELFGVNAAAIALAYRHGQ